MLKHQVLLQLIFFLKFGRLDLNFKFSSNSVLKFKLTDTDVVCVCICEKGRKEALSPQLINHFKGWCNNIVASCHETIVILRKNQKQRALQVCVAWYMLIVEVEGKGPQLCVDSVLFMLSCAPDHIMHEKNTLEQIQWDFKQIPYFMLHVGIVYKSKAFKKTVLNLCVSLSVSPIYLFIYWRLEVFSQIWLLEGA